MSDIIIQSSTLPHSEDLQALGSDTSSRSIQSINFTLSAIKGLNTKEKVAEILAPEKGKKGSPRKKLRPAMEGGKLPSSKPMAKNQISKKESKEEVAKRTPPQRVISSSSVRTTPVNKETQKGVTKSPRRRTSPPKGSEEKAVPNRGQLTPKGTTSLSVGTTPSTPSTPSPPRPILKEQSVKSVIPKVSTREPSQLSSFRYGISRNYPFDSSLVWTGRASQASATTNLSILLGTKTALSAFWGPHHIHLLRTQPKEPGPPKDVPVIAQAESDESSETSVKDEFNVTPLLDFEVEVGVEVEDEDEDEVEPEVESSAESPVYEVPVEEPTKDDQAERINFLQIFQNMTDIDELSSTESFDNRKYSIYNTEGKYVPLVDRSSHESEIFEESISDTPEEDIRISSSVNFNSSCSSEISLDGLIESDDDEPDKELSIVEEPHVEDISVQMASIVPKPRLLDFESSSQDDIIRLETIGIIETFLVGLLNQAVEYAEKPSHRLKRLDPQKLLKKLSEIYVDYEIEFQINQDLGRIVTDHFFRRKEFKYIDNSKEFDTIHKSRLTTALHELDCNLEREKEALRLSDNLLAEEKERERVARSLAVEQVEKFETKVKETLFKDGYDHLQYVTNDLFKQMDKVRDEVSQVRQKLTLVNHQLAYIKYKSEKMTNQSQGLSVEEFLSQHENNQSLSLKIDERNAELVRMKDHITYDIHAMAHLKNKEKTNQTVLLQMQRKLRSKDRRLRDLRDIIYAARLRHKRLQKEQQNLRHTGCLLHYPDMLRDYDATEELVLAKKKVIRKLKAEYRNIARRVTQVELTISGLERNERRSTNFRTSQFGQINKKILLGAKGTVY